MVALILYFVRYIHGYMKSWANYKGYFVIILMIICDAR